MSYNEERLRLNKSGVEDFQKEIERKEKELADLRMYKGKDAIYQGDNWHDNPTLYQAELKEMSLMKDISEMRKRLANAEIIESLDDETIVDIGDTVRVLMMMPEGDNIEGLYKLVATMPNFDPMAEVMEVSINSPIGNAMYQKKVGDNASYKVENRIINISILEKVNSLEQTNDSKVLTRRK